MNKKLGAFLFFSYAICSCMTSFAFSKNGRSRGSHGYELQEDEKYLSNKNHWFTGGQFFGSGKMIFNLGKAEVYSARFLHPTVNSFYKAYLENVSQYNAISNKTNDKGKDLPNYFYECFANNSTVISHFGFDFGGRYMWGKENIGMSLFFTLGYREIVNLKLKNDSEQYMINDLKQRGVSKADISTIQKIDNSKNDNDLSNDNDEVNYKLPETLKARLWNVDVLWDFYYCFVGNLVDLDECARDNFCLVGWYGVGARFNFAANVSDNIYDNPPKKNKKFVNDNLCLLSPITKFGLQALFKSGFFIEIDLLLQVLTIPYILQIPVPLPTFFKSSEMFDMEAFKSQNFDGLFALAAINPELCIRAGFDFYGLLKGEKLEEYYDN